MAEKLRQIPNWYVDQLGLSVQRQGRNTVAGIPIPVAITGHFSVDEFGGPL